MSTVTELSIQMREKFTPDEALLTQELRELLKLPIHRVRVVRVFRIRGTLSEEEQQHIEECVLSDHVLEEAYCPSDCPWVIEVGFKTGVTDNSGRVAQEAIEDALDRKLGEGQHVHSSLRYLIWGDLQPEDVERLSTECLANPLIEEVSINRPLRPLHETYPVTTSSVESVYLPDTESELLAFSRERQLALNLRELDAIRAFFARPDTQEARAEQGLGAEPTDAEIEVLAQTWSEHCKHKIFNAHITYRDGERVETINSLFKTYIRGSTEAIAERIDRLVSIFVDNAGIVRFDDEYNIAFKVETHNSPSALDPFGGALTGILGVNRDILGTGVGARPVANTDVFCFAPPDYSKELPVGILHPRRILRGVRRGVEEGGNKSGIPTVNGCLVFDDRYVGKPLVYCGTVGILPRQIQGVATEEKRIVPGDRIVVVGGRTGRDGIHGATFSSEELHEESPSSAVQIGDPFTQKKVLDFLMESRDRALYRTLTDNGAGGLSSSVGEIAELSGGACLDLSLVPRKAAGLHPWEVLVSESQERMTLAVAEDQLEELMEVAGRHEVEATVIGEFTSTGYFHVHDAGAPVAYLPLAFMHDGCPQLELEAEWTDEPPVSRSIKHADSLSRVLCALLSRPNICSKESIIRQYDHEVQGGTVIKPLCGVDGHGQSDAAVVWPVEMRRKESYQGIVISNGICPRYADFDCYAMAALAVDEAVRNAVATGVDPTTISLLDNFCWPDPIYDPVKTPDGKRKLAQLVRACRALYDVTTAWTPR